jgi:hypothetical protein
MDAKPFIEEKTGRTFVPIRYLAYGLGVAEKDVGWDAAKRQVSLRRGDVQALLTVGSKTLYRNGKATVMDTAPQIPKGEGRTYLPARWVAEALGYQVEWSPDDRLVICWPAGQPRPDQDIVKVKEYVAEKDTAASAGIPANAVPIASLDQLKTRVPHQDLADLSKHKVYQVEVTAADLPQPCDELGNVYRVEVDRRSSPSTTSRR